MEGSSWAGLPPALAGISWRSGACVRSARRLCATLLAAASSLGARRPLLHAQLRIRVRGRIFRLSEPLACSGVSCVVVVVVMVGCWVRGRGLGCLLGGCHCVVPCPSCLGRCRAKAAGTRTRTRTRPVARLGRLARAPRVAWQCCRTRCVAWELHSVAGGGPGAELLDPKSIGLPAWSATSVLAGRGAHVCQGPGAVEEKAAGTSTQEGAWGGCCCVLLPPQLQQHQTHTPHTCSHSPHTSAVSRVAVLPFPRPPPPLRPVGPCAVGCDPCTPRPQSANPPRSHCRVRGKCLVPPPPPAEAPLALGPGQVQRTVGAWRPLHQGHQG
jgi:hypothetical protein